MRVCGVIAEYDPFHKGHARHLRLAREQTQADYILCVMSGSFTQRGMPALFSAHDRAHMALACGADAVIQLPYAFSVREAEYFALGGVHILHALGCVTHLSFGCELDDLPLLQRAAQLLEVPTAEMTARVQEELARGCSHAQAVGSALAWRLGVDPALLRAPNTALALSYLRILLRLGSAIEPVPVLRTTGYHEKEAESYPSATAMRGAFLRGDWSALGQGLPPSAMEILQSALTAGRFCPPEGMDPLLRRMLLLSTPEQLSHLPGVGEGLEQRILQAARSAVTREALIAHIKTRRYTYGRISRALCHGVMGVTKADLPSLPTHARILGFRKTALPLLHKMQSSGFPLLSRPARAPLMALDVRADEMWQIMTRLPRGATYQQAPILYP